MKRILYTLAAIFIGCILSCTPDKDEVLEMGPVDMDHIKEIKLRTSHYQILADGKAQLEFNPLLTTEDGFTVQDSRVDHSQIEYYTSSGETLSKSILDFRQVTYRQNTQRVCQNQRHGDHFEHNDVHGHGPFRLERLHGNHGSGNIPFDSIQQGYSGLRRRNTHGKNSPAFR